MIQTKTIITIEINTGSQYYVSVGINEDLTIKGKVVWGINT